MFAGPNGSGKSTFKTMIRRELLGVYINPDEIEKEIRDQGFLDLTAFQIIGSKEQRTGANGRKWTMKRNRQRMDENGQPPNGQFFLLPASISRPF
jgi:predicted ABC-type ATPase